MAFSNIEKDEMLQVFDIAIVDDEEYQKQDGTHGIKVRLNKFRSLDKMKDIKEPTQVKMLDGSYVEYEDYMKNNGNSNSSNEIEVVNDMLPF